MTSNDCAYFYTMTPSAETATVNTGEDVTFHIDGVNRDSSISRVNGSSFKIAKMGFYRVSFQVSVSQSGRLVVTLNDKEIDYTRLDYVTILNDIPQIVNHPVIEVTSTDSILTIRNSSNIPLEIVSFLDSMSSYLAISRVQ